MSRWRRAFIPGGTFFFTLVTEMREPTEESPARGLATAVLGALHSDEEDLSQHMDYLHFNPVKHHYVACPADWLWSSIHRCVREGVYAANWGCGGLDAPDIATGES